MVKKAKTRADAAEGNTSTPKDTSTPGEHPQTRSTRPMLQALYLRNFSATAQQGAERSVADAAAAPVSPFLRGRIWA
jgi:hypothetical protein